MKTSDIKPGVRFLHARYVETDLLTPETYVVTAVRGETVYYTSAELYDKGHRKAQLKRDRKQMKTIVKKWL